MGTIEESGYNKRAGWEMTRKKEKRTAAVAKPPQKKAVQSERLGVTPTPKNIKTPQRKEQLTKLDTPHSIHTLPSPRYTAGSSPPLGL
jgi:hypothetical protein